MASEDARCHWMTLSVVGVVANLSSKRHKQRGSGRDQQQRDRRRGHTNRTKRRQRASPSIVSSTSAHAIRIFGIAFVMIVSLIGSCAARALAVPARRASRFGASCAFAKGSNCRTALSHTDLCQPRPISIVKTAHSNSFAISGRLHLSSTTNANESTSNGANHMLDVGDAVELIHDGAMRRGIIAESRGSGWFTVKLARDVGDDNGDKVVKKRSSQLTLITDAGMVEGQTTKAAMDASVGQSHIDEEMFEPPTIIDLDKLMRSGGGDNVQHSSSDILDVDLEQAMHHSQCDQWIIFSDLHCSPSSLATCLEVLDTVHEEASKRNAGVVFLGDFWHHRGTVRIDLLNAVLRALSGWEVPLIMIPGNHDQVTLGGLEHGLTPLRNAYYVEGDALIGSDATRKRRMQPGPMIITHPTKFKDAFFVPYIRSSRVLEYALGSRPSETASAHFVHVDVSGAYMNDLIVSRSGSPLSIFPSIGGEGDTPKPIYSGHFHKAHTVTAPKAAPGVAVRYVGSPYQTSLSEAGQAKELLVVDASQGWGIVESIPLTIGRRYHRLFSAQDLLSLGVVEPKDRVVISMTSTELEKAKRERSEGKEDDKSSSFDAKVKSLRKLGASVEIREMRAASTPFSLEAKSSDEIPYEELSPENTLKAYLAQERLRGNLDVEAEAELLRAGLSLVESLGSEFEGPQNMANDDHHANGASLEFASVTAKGFGPFADTITYPLSDRGLVLLRGNNQDEGSDSNGSGKTTLAMAVLWALTGSSDPRPMQDAKVSDVINFSSKSARVSVSGKVNDVPFEVTRVKAASKGSVSFVLDGNDLTRQSIKDTQGVIDQKLGISTQILARTIFHGQHAMNGLLEATDAALKDELSLLVPLVIWQQAASFSRRSQRSHSQRMSEVSGMVSVREQDRDALAQKCRAVQDSSEAYAKLYETRYNQVDINLQSLRASLEGASANETRIEECRQRFEEATLQITHLESSTSAIQNDRDINLQALQAEFDQFLAEDKTLTKNGQSIRRQADRSETDFERAKEKLRELRAMWGIEDDDLGSLSLPLTCPSCGQSIEGDDGVDHSHSNLTSSIRSDFEEISRLVDDAKAAYMLSRDDFDAFSLEQDKSEQKINELKQKVKDEAALWDDKIKGAHQTLKDCREAQSKWSANLREAEESYRQAAALESAENSATAELERLKIDAASSRASYEELHHELTSMSETLRELNEERSDAEQSSRTLTKLADIFGPRGIQSFVLQNAVQSLSSLSQNYLDLLSDDTLRLELALESGDRISRTAYIRSPDGNWIERPLSSLSGGQWRRCSLALNMGFTDLVAQQKNIRSSLVVLDEPLTHLDATGRAQVGKILRSLLQKSRGEDGTKSNLSTIVLILQDLAAEELEESFDSIDEVIKDNGSSQVVLDGMN